MKQSRPIFVTGLRNSKATNVATVAQEVGSGLIQAALSTTVWAFAATWLDLTGGIRLDTTVTTAIGMLVGVLTLLLVMASKAIKLRH
jgi:hypothetical protein